MTTGSFGRASGLNYRDPVSLSVAGSLDCGYIAILRTLRNSLLLGFPEDLYHWKIFFKLHTLSKTRHYTAGQRTQGSFFMPSLDA